MRKVGRINTKLDGDINKNFCGKKVLLPHSHFQGQVKEKHGGISAAPCVMAYIYSYI